MPDKVKPVISPDLIERVRNATGPDREMDADMAQAIECVEIQWRQANGTMEMYPVQRYPSKAHAAGFGIGPVPTYTASIDAVLALVERVLPGEGIVLETHGKNVAGIGQSGKHPSTGANPALAILAALLSALNTPPVGMGKMGGGE